MGAPPYALFVGWGFLFVVSDEQMRKRTIISGSTQLKTVVDQIEGLAREPGFIYTPALVLMRDPFMQLHEIADVNPREHLNIQEITFLSDLLVKKAIDFTMPSEDESARRFEPIYQLFEELHGEYSKRFIQQLTDTIENPQNTETRQRNDRRIFGAGLNVAEASRSYTLGGHSALFVVGNPLQSNEIPRSFHQPSQFRIITSQIVRV